MHTWRPCQVIPRSRWWNGRHRTDEANVVILERVIVIGALVRKLCTVSEVRQVLYDSGPRVVAVLFSLLVTALADPLQLRVMLALKSGGNKLIKGCLQLAGFSRLQPDDTDMY